MACPTAPPLRNVTAGQYAFKPALAGLKAVPAPWDRPGLSVPVQYARGRVATPPSAPQALPVLGNKIRAEIEGHPAQSASHALPECPPDTSGVPPWPFRLGEFFDPEKAAKEIGTGCLSGVFREQYARVLGRESRLAGS